MVFAELSGIVIGISLSEILTQNFGTAKVDVHELGSRSIILNVSQYPHHLTQRTRDGDLLCTYQRYIPQAQPTRGRCWEHTDQIRSRGENHGDQGFTAQSISAEHLRDQLLDRTGHLGWIVSLQPRGTPQGSNWHRNSFSHDLI